MTTMICKFQKNIVKVIQEWQESKMRWKKTKTNSKQSPPPSSLRCCRSLPECKPPRDPVDSAFHACRFRPKQSTRWIPNWSNTSTRKQISRSDRTNLGVAIALAVFVLVKSKNAGWRQLIIWNDHHVGNTSAGDDTTRCVNTCVNIRFCLASIPIIPLQRNPLWTKKPIPKAPGGKGGFRQRW